MCASVLRFSFVLLADSFGCLLACFYLFILSCSALICCALVRSAAQGRQGKASHVLFIPSKKKKENHPKKKKKKKSRSKTPDICSPRCRSSRKTLLH